MNLLDLYFNPSGRINRSTFWLKGILLLSVIWVVVWVIWAAWVGILELLTDPVALMRLIQDIWSNPEVGLFKFILIPLAFVAVSHWNSYTITVKRLHDRDKSAWWLLAWAGVYLLGILTVAIIIGGFILLALYIWILVWLGFLEGTPYPNRYGEPTTQPYGYRSGQPSGYGPQQTRYGPQERPLPRPPGDATQARMKTCPYCAESIRYAAIRCRYCGSDIPPPEADAPRRSGRMKTCPYCAESIPYEELKCRYCDSEVPEEADSPQP